MTWAALRENSVSARLPKISRCPTNRIVPTVTVTMWMMSSQRLGVVAPTNIRYTPEIIPIPREITPPLPMIDMPSKRLHT